MRPQDRDQPAQALRHRSGSRVRSQVHRRLESRVLPPDGGCSAHSLTPAEARRTTSSLDRLRVRTLGSREFDVNESRGQGWLCTLVCMPTPRCRGKWRWASGRSSHGVTDPRVVPVRLEAKRAAARTKLALDRVLRVRGRTDRPCAGENRARASLRQSRLVPVQTSWRLCTKRRIPLSAFQLLTVHKCCESGGFCVDEVSSVPDHDPAVHQGARASSCV